MERFAMYGKVTAKPGERDKLVEHLLEASRLVAPLPGCEVYLVNLAVADADTVWVTEIWRSEADHDNSLKLESVQALIARTRPLVAGFEGVRLVPVGGKGFPIA